MSNYSLNNDYKDSIWDGKRAQKKTRESLTAEIKELKSSQANVKNAITEMQSQVEAFKTRKVMDHRDRCRMAATYKSITFIS